MLGEGSGGSVVLLVGAQEDSHGSPPDCVPRHGCQDRSVATLGQSVQSLFSQEIKKKNIQLGWHPGLGPGSFPHSGTGCLLCEGQQGPVEAIQAHQSPGSQGLETWGPWSSTGRGTDGAHTGLAEGPAGLVLWHLGPTACCKPVRSSPLDSSPNTQGCGGSSLWVWASTAPAEGVWGAGGPVRSPRPAP